MDRASTTRCSGTSTMYGPWGLSRSASGHGSGSSSLVIANPEARSHRESVVSVRWYEVVKPVSVSEIFQGTRTSRSSR